MDDETPRSQDRQAEADAIGLTVEKILELEQNRRDEAEAKIRGIEVWELRMQRSGASETEIQSEREKRRRNIQDIISE
jgi:hypothetical protein